MASNRKKPVDPSVGVSFTPQAWDKAVMTGVKSKLGSITQTPSKISKIVNVVKKGADLINSPVGQMATSLIGMIPGVGGLAAKGLKFLANIVSANDDEWFEGYKGAGATFNEPLGLVKYESNQASASFRCWNLTGCIARVTTYLPDNTEWKDQLLPSILAYVRDKTNNVLNATEQEYWTAFTNAMSLYAYYYVGRKYLAIARDVPTNITNISQLYPCIQPSNISQFRGIIDELEDYLKATVRLPYALTGYIRWRFGTCFKSANTGRPGLVLYDNIDIKGTNVAVIVNNIAQLRTSLTAVGRAMSDIKLAYKDHSVKYDVEERMFDNKEFNLRANIQSFKDPIVLTAPKGNFILLDSRLDQNAAFQAVTLSTQVGTSVGTQKAPFAVATAINVDFYMPNTFTLNYKQKSGSTETDSSTTVSAGWHTATVDDTKGSKAMELVIVAEVVASNQHAGYMTARWRTTHSAMGSTYASVATVMFEKYIAALALDALEFHNMTGTAYMNVNGTVGTYDAIRTYGLSYDTAYVADEAILSTQRLAMRNLTRGDYSKATAPNTREESVDALQGVADAVVDLV